MTTRSQPHFGIEALLNLHGWNHEVGGGLWISIKAIQVAPDAGRPHGISYSLTMHAPGGERIVGFDNAHLPDIGAGPARRSMRRGRGSNHRHYRGRVAWYDFVSPEKLMEDFWNDLQRVMQEEGVPWTE